MGSLIADDSFVLKDLRMFIDPMEIYDTEGKILGVFVPAKVSPDDCLVTILHYTSP